MAASLYSEAYPSGERLGESLNVFQFCSAHSGVYGAAASLATLSERLRLHGHQVIQGTLAGRALGNEFRQRGFDVREVKLRAKVDLRGILDLRKILLREQIDVIQTHLSTASLNGGIAARLARIPSVSTVHGMSNKASYVFADHLIAVSRQAREHLIRQGVRPERISVVYNGIEVPPTLPSRKSARQALGLPANAPVLGTVARITTLKGIRYGIEAMSLLVKDFPDLTYVILGDGDQAESMRRLTANRQLENRIRFCGYQPDVWPYLAAMDVFLFPSLKEAMGIALIESMAAGLPVVSTRVGGIPEVVTQATGVLVSPKDGGELAEATRRLLLAPELREELGAAGRRRVEQEFSAAAMASKTESVYEAVVVARSVRDLRPVSLGE